MCRNAVFKSNFCSHRSFAFANLLTQRLLATSLSHYRVIHKFSTLYLISPAVAAMDLGNPECKLSVHVLVSWPADVPVYRYVTGEDRHSRCFVSIKLCMYPFNLYIPRLWACTGSLVIQCVTVEQQCRCTSALLCHGHDLINLRGLYLVTCLC